MKFLIVLIFCLLFHQGKSNGNLFQARSLYGLKYGYDYLFAPICDSEITDTLEVQGMMISSEDNVTEFTSQLNELDVLLYPNPSHDFINISGINIADCNIQILDQLGRRFEHEKTIKHQNLLIINAPLEKGLYTIIIKNNKKEISKKMIIN